MSQQNSLQSHQPSHPNNGWTTRGEKLVRYWQEECRLYAWMYEQNATYYSRLNRTLGIASIALSAITGTTLFNQSATDPDSTSSNVLIGLGVSSIASTILSGLKELLDLNSLITQNTNAARENSSIVMDIDEQMNIERADRIDGREFLKSIKDRKNALIQNGPIIPSRQWKNVHRKIQSKEQLGFLNREVFNEYLEQSVDINKLHFGTPTNNGNTTNLAQTVIDYGTPSSNSTALDTAVAHNGSAVIDIPHDQSTLNKRATLAEKLAYYGGNRCQILPAITDDTTESILDVLSKEIENLQPRCAARKAILENQYELERLLSKSGELKNKDRQQIANLREKARVLRENYNKLINTQIADYNIIVNNDCQRISRIIRAYRDGFLSEPELFRIIQLDLMEVDKEIFIDETRLMDLMSKIRHRLDQIQSDNTNINKSRYPFREIRVSNNTPNTTSNTTANTVNNEIIDVLSNLYQHKEMITNQISSVRHEIVELEQQISTCTEDKKEILNAKLTEVLQINANLMSEYELLNSRIENIEQTNNIGYAKLVTVNRPIDTNTIAYTSNNYDTSPLYNSGAMTAMMRHEHASPQLQFEERPSSTAPSDDEFIENMISDNLCAKQLRDVIKPISTTSAVLGLNNQDISSVNTGNATKSPKRRSSKYDAQMRYQTGRIS